MGHRDSESGTAWLGAILIVVGACVNGYAWAAGPWWCWIIGTALCILGVCVAFGKIADLGSDPWL